jgi:hypothetical protein
VIQGVPQGSVLGPVLFLLFVNDMPLEIINSTINIYVDDTKLLSCSKWNDFTTLKQTITQDLNNIERWAIENKMFLKSEYQAHRALRAYCLSRPFYGAAKMATKLYFED